jgi:hypothetical protein
MVTISQIFCIFHLLAATQMNISLKIQFKKSFVLLFDYIIIKLIKLVELIAF